MKVAVTIAIVAAIYLFRLDPYAGLLLDDGWYMVLGKALSLGEGFRLISSSEPPILPSVPPGFPALLSIVFWFFPSYPGNVILLKSVSIAAMAGVGAACWYDYTRHRQLDRDTALWMAAAVVLTPALVFLATSAVMAENVFMLVQLLTVIAVERARRRDAADVRRPMAAGCMAAATMLVRVAGVATVAAGLAYFLVNRRWRQAAVFAVTAAALVLPWQVYARATAPTLEERMAHGGTIAYAYERLLAMERPGAIGTAVSAGEFARRGARNVADMLTRDVGALFLPTLYRGPSESGEEVISVGEPGRGSMGGATGTMIVSGLLAVVMMIGLARTASWWSLPALLVAASIAMIATVGSQTIRYVVPLAPFLLLFLWRGMMQPAAARILVATIIGFHLIDHGLFLRAKATSTPNWIAEAREVEDVLDWMSTGLADAGPVVSSNPGLVYLRTGRKGVALAFPERNWERWEQSGVRYVAALRPWGVPAVARGRKVLLKTERGLWIVKM